MYIRIYRYIHIYLVTYIRRGAPVYPPEERRARAASSYLSCSPSLWYFPLVLPFRSLSVSPCSLTVGAMYNCRQGRALGDTFLPYTALNNPCSLTVGAIYNCRQGRALGVTFFLTAHRT